MNDILLQGITYIRAAWRYRWYAMLLAWVIAIAGWLVVYKLPDQYQASARVYVDTDSILRPLLRGLAVQTNVSQRLSLISRTILSRPNLEKVARMADLDIEANDPDHMENLVNRLARDIKLGDTTRQNLYTISYPHENPEVAKRIVESLLTIFVENALGDTRKDSNAAQRFLDQQIEEYEQRLIEAEERLKEFKRENVDLMSSSGQGYFERLRAAQDELAQARLRLKEAQIRRDELGRQLRGEEPVFGLGTMPKGMDVQAHPLNPRIENLKGRLDELLFQYTDKHPDVIALQEILRDLERQKSEDLRKLARSKPLYSSSELDTNPVYQQMKISLGQAEAEVATLSVRVEEYESKVEDLKSKVNTIPEIEAQIKRLDRDYAINKSNYDALVARRESAKISESADETGDDVKFRVIDPPHVPSSPSGPNRLLFSSGVFVASLLAGMALAFLLSQIRPAVYDGYTLRKLTGLPVFGSVSRVWTPELLMRRRMQLGAFVGASFMLVVVYGGVVYVHRASSLV